MTDSFTLMPSWIRAHVKIDGETLAECDFKALHPNIIMALYEGKEKFLTHKLVGDRLGIDEDELATFKKRHLAFFNKRLSDMDRDELLTEYYLNHEPELLERLRRDKELYWYTHTSKVMFKKEVEIMTACIEKLNAIGIFVLYVYDALLCERKHMDTVVQVMNATVLEHGVFTLADAKLLGAKASGPLEIATNASDFCASKGESGRACFDNQTPADGNWQEAA